MHTFHEATIEIRSILVKIFCQNFEEKNLTSRVRRIPYSYIKKKKLTTLYKIILFPSIQLGN